MLGGDIHGQGKSLGNMVPPYLSMHGEDFSAWDGGDGHANYVLASNTPTGNEGLEKLGTGRALFTASSRPKYARCMLSAHARFAWMIFEREKSRVIQPPVNSFDLQTLANLRSAAKITRPHLMKVTRGAWWEENVKRENDPFRFDLAKNGQANERTGQRPVRSLIMRAGSLTQFRDRIGGKGE